MANRIVGNVLIVDSAMGNSLVIPGTQISKYRVSAWSFWSLNTTGSLLLTGANTSSDIQLIYDTPAGSSGAQQPNPKWFSFGMDCILENLKAPVVTNGTAFLYLA